MQKYRKYFSTRSAKPGALTRFSGIFSNAFSPAEIGWSKSSSQTLEAASELCKSRGNGLGNVLGEIQNVVHGAPNLCLFFRSFNVVYGIHRVWYTLKAVGEVESINLVSDSGMFWRFPSDLDYLDVFIKSPSCIFKAPGTQICIIIIAIHSSINPPILPEFSSSRHASGTSDIVRLPRLAE